MTIDAPALDPGTPAFDPVTTVVADPVAPAVDPIAPAIPDVPADAVLAPAPAPAPAPFTDTIDVPVLVPAAPAPAPAAPAPVETFIPAPLPPAADPIVAPVAASRPVSVLAPAPAPAPAARPVDVVAPPVPTGPALRAPADQATDALAATSAGAGRGSAALITPLQGAADTPAAALGHAAGTPPDAILNAAAGAPPDALDAAVPSSLGSSAPSFDSAAPPMPDALSQTTAPAGADSTPAYLVDLVNDAIGATAAPVTDAAGTVGGVVAPTLDAVANALDATTVPDIVAGQVPSALETLGALVGVDDIAGAADQVIDAMTAVPGLAPVTPAEIGAALAPLAEVASNPRVLVSATVLTVAAASFAPRGGSAAMAAEAQMAFTHVRLIPCLVKANVDRYATMIVDAARPAGTALSALRTVSTPTAHAAVDARGSIRLEGLLDGVQQPARDGLTEAAESAARPRALVAAAATSSGQTLLLWIGMLLAWPSLLVVAARRQLARVKAPANVQPPQTLHR